MSERSASGSLSAVVVSRVTWDSLPEAQRATLRDVFAQMTTVFRPTFIRAEQQAEQTLRARGVTVTTLTDPERARWRALFARVRTRVAATIAEPGWIDRVRAASRP